MDKRKGGDQKKRHKNTEEEKKKGSLPKWEKKGRKKGIKKGRIRLTPLGYNGKKSEESHHLGEDPRLGGKKKKKKKNARRDKKKSTKEQVCGLDHGRRIQKRKTRTPETPNLKGSLGQEKVNKK